MKFKSALLLVNLLTIGGLGCAGMIDLREQKGAMVWGDGEIGCKDPETECIKGGTLSDNAALLGEAVVEGED